MCEQRPDQDVRDEPPRPVTAEPGYAHRLERLESAAWKRWLNVQAPYAWNVRRLCRGQVLDLGCGIGRNLAHLGDRAVGVDHNEHAVRVAQSRGLVAFTPAEFWVWQQRTSAGFDTLLAAHLLEHLAEQEADDLLRGYLPLVHPGGRVVMITPQERGWHSDDTHVRWVGFGELARTSSRLRLSVLTRQSFPLPRAAGRVFRYNEFVHVATVSSRTS